MTTEDRFWAKVQKTESCWLWTADTTWNGYGRIKINHRKILAHRFSYEIHKESIPEKMVIDHICRTRNCVNPSHLRVVTRRQNVLENAVNTAPLIARAKTHCKNGHPFNEENTYWNFKRYNNRQCRICKGAADKRARLKKRKKQA